MFGGGIMKWLPWTVMNCCWELGCWIMLWSCCCGCSTCWTCMCGAFVIAFAEEMYWSWYCWVGPWLSRICWHPAGLCSWMFAWDKFPVCPWNWTIGVPVLIGNPALGGGVCWMICMWCWGKKFCCWIIWVGCWIIVGGGHERMAWGIVSCCWL